MTRAVRGALLGAQAFLCLTISLAGAQAEETRFHQSCKRAAGCGGGLEGPLQLIDTGSET